MLNISRGRKIFLGRSSSPQKGYVRPKKEISEKKQNICTRGAKNKIFKRFLLRFEFNMTMASFMRCFFKLDLT